MWGDQQENVTTTDEGRKEQKLYYFLRLNYRYPFEGLRKKTQKEICHVKLIEKIFSSFRLLGPLK